MNMTLNELRDRLVETEAYVHVTSSGAGSMIQYYLWAQPGASAWLSGASFPYSKEETDEFLGFEPGGYVTEQTAIDLACAAYMKAFRFGKKNPIGLGLTTSVASLKEHHGDHRIHGAVVTNGGCFATTVILEKGTGLSRRLGDDALTCNVALDLLRISIGMPTFHATMSARYRDASDELMGRIMERPVFCADGQRLYNLPNEPIALMPGAYNPPHDGHFGIATAARLQYGFNVFHHVTIDSPHKPWLKPQDVLQRARLLKHHNAVFTIGDPLYLQKAEKYPGTPIIMGADALERMLDPCWGEDPTRLLARFAELGTSFFVTSRLVDGVRKTFHDILSERGLQARSDMFHVLDGTCDISSTEIRNAKLSRG